MNDKRKTDLITALAAASESRMLTAAEYHRLTEVPPEAVWFQNIENPGTRRIYEADLKEFIRFLGIGQATEFRTVTRRMSSNGARISSIASSQARPSGASSPR